MALSGLHVICGYAGGRGYDGQAQPLMTSPQWSETMTNAGSTTGKATARDRNLGAPVFRVRSSADAWVAHGKEPDASSNTSGPRYYVEANKDFDIFVEPGDILDWVAA